MTPAPVALSVATAEDLQAVLAQANFLAGSGVRVTAVEAGQCEVTLPYAAQFDRPGGLISGMTLMGLADVAMWLAIMTLRGTRETWVTTDMKTAFLRSGLQESVVCRASVLKQSRRTAYGTAEAHGAASGLLTHHTLTYAQVLGR